MELQMRKNSSTMSRRVFKRRRETNCAFNKIKKNKKIAFV